MPVEKQIEYLNSFSEKELEILQYTYEFWARENQLFPETKGIDYSVWAITSGRAWGKTFVGSNYILNYAQNNPGSLIALVGKTAADVRDVMIEVGPSSILNQAPPWFKPNYVPSKRRLEFPNGSICISYSGDEPSQLRGPSFSAAWLDEWVHFKYAEDVWSNLNFCMRGCKNPRILITTTPLPLKILKDVLKQKGTYHTTGSTFENTALPDSVLTLFREKWSNTRIGAQELEGQILEDFEGAIWKRNDIDESRVTYADMPTKFEKIFIGVDVAVSANKTSDSTGIISIGILNKHAYVISDDTAKYSPQAMATKLFSLHDAYVSSIVGINDIYFVVEKNNGGSFIETTIRLVEKNLNRSKQINISEVWAKDSKKKRAETVFTLYEQKRVHHCGFLHQLENQQCTWTPESNESPDRIDALCWALTESLVKKQFEHKTSSKGIW